MRAIEQGGMAAYKDMMESPRLPCYDARTQGIPPTGVELVRYIGDLTYTNGNGNPHTVEFWAVKDAAGSAGYTWLPKKASLPARSEEHTSELQSLMRISYAVFCLKKKKKENNTNIIHKH